MDNNQEKSLINKKILKIIIPFLIIVIIAGIWFIKNNGPKLEDKNGTGGKLVETEDFLLNVTEKLDLEKLKSYGLPIMIDFGADSCAPCRVMAPVLLELNNELQERAIIKYVDVWKDPELAKGYPISVIPTQMFFDKDGKPYQPLETQKSPMIIYSLKDTQEHIFTTHEGGMTKDMILDVLKEMGMEE